MENRGWTKEKQKKYPKQWAKVKSRFGTKGKHWKLSEKSRENQRKAHNSGRKKKGDWTGEKNPRWKGGITDIHQKIRTSPEYKLWRESVFRRDKYTCIWCGATNGNGKTVTLHADHIKSFSLFPELRFAIDNGRTLCFDCHKTTDTYGGGSHKKNL